MTKPNEPEGLERYTIHLVAEEASEAIQMTGKWGRFGPDHARRDGLTARAGLALELGDVLAAIDFALCAGLIDPKKMLDQREAKFARLTDPDAVDDEGRPLAPPLPSEAARLYIAPAQPVADAGGVTDRDWLPEDIWQSIPQYMHKSIERYAAANRLQSVAAATAAKDAILANPTPAMKAAGAAVVGSHDLAHECWAQMFRAALSEAREAGPDEPTCIITLGPSLSIGCHLSDERRAERDDVLAHMEWWEKEGGDSEGGWLNALIGQIESGEHVGAKAMADAREVGE